MSMVVASTHKPKITAPPAKAAVPSRRPPTADPQRSRSRRRRRRSAPRRRPPSRRPSGRRLSHVPKMKSHKGAQKRFGVTGSGKVYRVKSWRGHHLEIKSSRRTRRYAGKAIVDRTSARAGPAPAAVPLGAPRPMARVKRGVTSHKRHKRLLKAAEGRRGTRSKLDQAGPRGAAPRDGLRLSRPQGAQAPAARAVDRPAQRRRAPATA